MWFRQIQLFKIKSEDTLKAEELSEKLEKLKFHPCLPSLPISLGWVPPTEDAEEDANFETETESEVIQKELSYVHASNHCLMICLKIEEKILPASVINNRVKDRIKEIEGKELRKVSGKEKQALREDIYQGLMTQAFGKLSKIYAYIDTKNNWLVLNTTTAKKTEMFISFLKKTLSDVKVSALEFKKISTILTHWIQNNKYPTSLSIEEKAVLQDPNKQNRVVRCQQQDLFSSSMLSLLKEGYEISQLQLTWHDQLTFTLQDDFMLRTLKYQDAVIELSNEATSETKVEQFSADFVIMTGILSQLLLELLEQFGIAG